MKQLHASFSPGKEIDLAERVVRFCRFVKDEGFNVGIKECLDAIGRSQQVILAPDAFYFTLRSLLATSKRDWDRFDALFRQFWFEGYGYRQIVRKKRSRQAAEKKTSIPLLMIAAQSDGAEEPGKSTTGANALERLKKTDLNDVPAPDMEAMEALIVRLSRQMKQRISRKKRVSTQQRYIDLKRTMRKNIGQGGDPIRLAFKSKKMQQNRITALLDVSGSMDQYSYFLLLFIHSLRRELKDLTAFAFSTRLANITRAVGVKKIKEAMALAAEEAEAWSSGTRIGSCFQAFNTLYGKQCLHRDSIVLILSDGLDTDDPGKLVEALAYIKERVRKIIWLNPLKGMAGYAPETEAMKRALPYLDVFISARDVESLINLERHL